MCKEKIWLKQLQECSPLDMPQTIGKIEFYNKQSAEDLLKDIDEEFTGKKGAINNFLVPAFASIITTLSFETNNKYIKKVKSLGLTAENINEAFGKFSYEAEGFYDLVDTSSNLGFENDKKYSEEVRKSIDNVKYRDNLKEERFKGKKYIHSDYSNKRIYKNNDAVTKNGLNNHNEKVTEVDHIKPLKQIFNDLKYNIALDENDIKEIANIDENLAFVERNINRSKREQENSDYLNSNKKLANTLNNKTRENMIAKQNEATKALNKKQNEVVFNKLFVKTETKGANKVSSIGLTDKGKEVGKQLYKKSKEENVNLAKNRLAGDILVVFLRASYFELSDSIKNGIQYKLNSTSKIVALGMRLKRVGKYILFKFKDLLSSSFFNFIKDLILSIIKGLINLFTGVITSIGKIVIGGINSIIQAIKIMRMPKEQMSYAQKADAIVKIVSSTVILSCGNLIEGFLNKIPFLNNYIKIVKPILIGFLVALVGYFLDKLDIFGAKAEQRALRIKEIFKLRAEEIQNNTKEFVQYTEKTLHEQLEVFKDWKDDILQHLSNNNSDKVLGKSFEIMKEFNVNQDYSNKEQFKKRLNLNGVLEL